MYLCGIWTHYISSDPEAVTMTIAPRSRGVCTIIRIKLIFDSHPMWQEVNVMMNISGFFTAL
jgi:hypothetical protein